MYTQEGIQREMNTPQPLQGRRGKVCINKSNKSEEGQVPRRLEDDRPQLGTM